MARVLPDVSILETRTPVARYASAQPRRPGFSLVDLLVSMAVIAILLSLLSPTLGRVAETARRVKCQKKLSDVGLALTMWAGDHRDAIPESDVADDVFSADTSTRGDFFQPSSLMEIAHFRSDDPSAFDGLGRLVSEGYLSDASALYCPSHRGEHPYDQYAGAWMSLDGEIVINFHYRLFPGMVMLGRLDPKTTLVTDGMRSTLDYSHRTGNNLLRADMSVDWYADEDQYIAQILPVVETAPTAGLSMATTWTVMDTGKTPTKTAHPADDAPTSARSFSIIGGDP